MDLGLYLRVIRRHLPIFIVGAALSVAAGVAIFAMSAPSYLARSTLVVTQAGFPWGRSTLDENVPVKGDSRLTVPRFGDPTRMEYLASVYAKLAAGDDIVGAATRAGVAPDYQVDVLVSLTGTALPLIQVTGFGASPAEATATTNRVASTFQSYIGRRQAAAKIADSSRVQLQRVSRAQVREAEVAVGRRPARPVMVFLLGLMLTTGVVFVKDNLRRQASVAPAPSGVRRDPEIAQALPQVAVAVRGASRWGSRRGDSAADGRAADESVAIRTVEAGGRRT